MHIKLLSFYVDISKKYLIEHYNSLQKECAGYASKINNEFKRKDIHNFRVAIKKMNAFKSFIKFTEPEFEITEKELEKIYKSAGRLRTLTLLKKGIEDLKLFDKQWKKHFRNDLKKEKESYSKIYREFEKAWKDKSREQADKIFFIINEENKLEESAGKYINSLFSNINKVSNNIPQTSFHDIRKLMKEFGYNYSLLCEAFYFLTDEKLISEINNLNKILGKWHDRVVLKKFIMKNEFEGRDRIAEQVQMGINTDEDYIQNLLNAFTLKNGGAIFLKYLK